MFWLQASICDSNLSRKLPLFDIYSMKVWYSSHYFEKVHQLIEKVHQKLEKVHQKLEKVHQKLEKVHQKTWKSSPKTWKNRPKMGNPSQRRPR